MLIVLVVVLFSKADEIEVVLLRDAIGLFKRQGSPPRGQVDVVGVEPELAVEVQSGYLIVVRDRYQTQLIGLLGVEVKFVEIDHMQVRHVEYFDGEDRVFFLNFIKHEEWSVFFRVYEVLRIIFIIDEHFV